MLISREIDRERERERERKRLKRERERREKLVEALCICTYLSENGSRNYDGFQSTIDSSLSRVFLFCFRTMNIRLKRWALAKALSSVTDSWPLEPLVCTFTL